MIACFDHCLNIVVSPVAFPLCINPLRKHKSTESSAKGCLCVHFLWAFAWLSFLPEEEWDAVRSEGCHSGRLACVADSHPAAIQVLWMPPTLHAADLATAGRDARCAVSEANSQKRSTGLASKPFHPFLSLTDANPSFSVAMVRAVPLFISARRFLSIWRQSGSLSPSDDFLLATAQPRLSHDSATAQPQPCNLQNCPSSGTDQTRTSSKGSKGRGLPSPEAKTAPAADPVTCPQGCHGRRPKGPPQGRRGGGGEAQRGGGSLHVPTQPCPRGHHRELQCAVYGAGTVWQQSPGLDAGAGVDGGLGPLERG